MKKIILLILIIFTSCGPDPTEFSEKALKDTVLSFNNSKLPFEQILLENKGKKILIDVWASWCKDCIVGLPKIKKIQNDFPNVVYLFLSVDKNIASWKRGIKRYNLIGKHYNLPKGMNEGDFVDFLNVNWIPRYLLVDETGKITVFNAKKATDKNLLKALQK
ncbi:TlpA family protein disulfide reductase [uncultured Polaribacter sp.]|uniref:TlpA family protein disulfide reductase n=1 Tax=uncultured Polaribacter sp. TaxID=174711 RepID=UPI00263894F5|nr:TlpA family protein disulfide reductase [uncultured Polaribacter sp.]